MSLDRAGRAEWGGVLDKKSAQAFQNDNVIPHNSQIWQITKSMSHTYAKSKCELFTRINPGLISLCP